MPGRPYAKILAGVPVLIAEPAPSASLLPVVLWHHGFNADALAHAAELERCADAGFLAVGIDAVGHGARRDPTLGPRVAAAGRGGIHIMLDVAEATLAEQSALIDALADVFPIDHTRVSLVGISMGAFLCYRAIVTSPPLRAVVALLGSPEWPRATSPHHALHTFQNVALLSITAERDTHVPPDAAQRLHEQLHTHFPHCARHHHHSLLGSGHLTSAESWSEAMRETQRWLLTHA
jgi:uncharacterized protein